MTLHRVPNKGTSNAMGVTNDQKLITVSQHLRLARLLMRFVFYISYIYLRRLVPNTIYLNYDVYIV